MDCRPMKVAIVHDWFTVYTGSERVVEHILQLYPQADLFSLVDFLPTDERGFLMGRPVHTSFLQRLPFARQKYRQYLALMPLAIEQFDFSGYDLVLSSSHAVAKGAITSPDQLHASYIHSPMRYAWDMQGQYLAESRLERGLGGAMARLLLHSMRQWDYASAARPDVLAANSQFVAGRIRKFYRRDAQVVYPPVDVSAFPIQTEKDDYYLTASRLVQYKRVELVVRAFAGMPKRRLVVIGDGPELARLRRIAPSNVDVRGFQPTPALSQAMQRARAFVFAAQEDFGITLLEAQACGTPVITYRGGGPRETINGLDSPHPGGVFFDQQGVVAIQSAVEQFETHRGQISPQACRENALRFSPERFRLSFAEFVDRAWYTRTVVE